MTELDATILFTRQLASDAFDFISGCQSKMKFQTDHPVFVLPGLLAVTLWILVKIVLATGLIYFMRRA